MISTLMLAMGASCLLTLVLGKFVIAELKKLRAGQEIRKEGPSWHAGKAGTPTMGGIMFIVGSGVVSFVMGWESMLRGEFAHLYVYLFALIFGLIGFVDDYRKVRQHQNEGLSAKQKFLLQLAAAVLFLTLMRYEGLLTNALYVPFLNVTVTVNWIFYLIFAAFVIVGCVNAVNLTDGIDGQSSSVTFVVMVFFTAAAAMWKLMPLALFPAALAGGLAAFFCYNRQGVHGGHRQSLYGRRGGGPGLCHGYAPDFDIGGHYLYSGDPVRHYPGVLLQGHPRQALFQDGASASSPGALRLERGEAGDGVFRCDHPVLYPGLVWHPGEVLRQTF